MAQSQSNQSSQPDPAELQQAQARLAEAQQQAADAASGLAAVVTRGIPPITVEVLPGNTVGHDDVAYEEGQQIEMSGPTAIALVQSGHVKIVGSGS